MAEHTPAPWQFHQPWAGFSKITGSSGELIFGIAAGLPEEKRPDEECAANARLISAAPELLSAAKRALNVLRANGESVRSGNVLGALSDAIAKATGDARPSPVTRRGR